jgi:hypothetical protein
MFLADSQTPVRDGFGRCSPSSAPPVEYLRATVWVNEEMSRAGGQEGMAGDLPSGIPGPPRRPALGSEEAAFSEIRSRRFSVEFHWAAPKQGMEESEINGFFESRAPAYRFNADRFL